MSPDRSGSAVWPPHVAEPGTARRLRVLIAEDNRDAAASLAALVEDAGHSTSCVYRGRDVLGAAHIFSPDVVLLDIGMPGIDGYDVARILRKVYGTKLWLIAVTAWNRTPDKFMAKAAGFDHHFGKPYDPIELLAMLELIAADKGIPTKLRSTPPGAA